MYDNNPITFLNLHRLPARVDYQGAGVLLHFEPVAIRALVELGHLKPVVNRKSSEHKYFCTKTILALADNEKWIRDASRAVCDYWGHEERASKVGQASKSMRRFGAFVGKRGIAKLTPSLPRQAAFCSEKAGSHAVGYSCSSNGPSVAACQMRDWNLVFTSASPPVCLPTNCLFLQRPWR